MKKQIIFCFPLFLGTLATIGTHSSAQFRAGNNEIAPIAKWVFSNESNPGFDSATEKGTNKHNLTTYHLDNYEDVVANNGEITINNNVLYAATADSDPSFQSAAKKDSTFCFSLTLPNTKFSSRKCPVSFRWTSWSCYSMFLIRPNTHDLYYVNSDSGLAGVDDASLYGEGALMTYNPGQTYDIVMSMSIYGNTKIYIDGNSTPAYDGKTFKSGLGSAWSSLCIGGVARSRNGKHQMDIFENICNGMKMSNAAYYDFAFNSNMAKEFHETKKVTGVKPEQYIPEFIHDPQPDFNIIRDSELKSRVYFISDTHFVGNNRNPLGDGYVTTAFEDMNSLGVNADAVINLGDLSDTGCDRGKQTLPYWYDLVESKPVVNANGTKVPFYGILGNHDVRGDSNNASLGAGNSPARQEDFLTTARLYQEKEPYNDWGNDTTRKGTYGDNQVFLDLNYVAEINGYHYLFINTCESQWDVCHLTLENLEWIDNTLTLLEKTDGNKPIFLLVHQPIDEKNQSIYIIDETGKRIENDFAFHEMLAKHQTTIVCTGHTHRPFGINHLFQGVSYSGNKVANYINLPSLEYNNYSDYEPTGVEGYQQKEMVEYSDIQYYVMELYENGLIFRAREVTKEKNNFGVEQTIHRWREDADMGVLFNGKVTFKDKDGETISEKTYKCGDEIEIPADPDTSLMERTTFKGWSPEVSPICHGDVTYIPNFVVRPEGAPESFVVKFDNNGKGGNIETKTIKYGFSIGAVENLQAEGYTFGGWFLNRAGTLPIDIVNDEITSNLTLYAKWIPNEGTAYKVEHYLEEASNVDYKLVLTENLTGTTDSLTQAKATRSLDDYRVNNFVQQTISGDGSTVVKIYYDRPRLTTNIINNDAKGSYVLSTEKPRFGGNLTITFNPNKNFEVSLLKINGEEIEITSNEYTIYNLHDNLEIVIKYKETNKGCAGSIMASSLMVSAATFGAAILLKKRKENKVLID